MLIIFWDYDFHIVVEHIISLFIGYSIILSNEIKTTFAYAKCITFLCKVLGLMSLILLVTFIQH